MEFCPPAVPAERFVAPSHSEPLNQPWGQATPKGTETASLIVLETSLQPCLSLPHLFIILENFHLWTLWDWAVSGDCGEVEGKGEHCSMAVLGCAGTLAMGELGPGIVGAQPVLENREGHWYWSQPSPGSASTSHQVLHKP